MFESMDKLLLGLVTGLAFGFLLQKARVTKYQVILGQLLLKDWTVLKVMLTGIIVGSMGVYTLVELGIARLDIWPFQVAGVLVGAIVFGTGMAIFGYCPGTGVAASGEGSRDAMVGLLGLFFGANIFVAVFSWLEPIINAFGDLGKLTFPELLDMPPWAVIAILTAMGLLVFSVLEGYQRRTSPPGETR